MLKKKRKNWKAENWKSRVKINLKYSFFKIQYFSNQSQLIPFPPLKHNLIFRPLIVLKPCCFPLKKQTAQDRRIPIVNDIKANRGKRNKVQFYYWKLWHGMKYISPCFPISFCISAVRMEVHKVLLNILLLGTREYKRRNGVALKNECY